MDRNRKTQNVSCSKSFMLFKIESYSKIYRLITEITIGYK